MSTFAGERALRLEPLPTAGWPDGRTALAHLGLEPQELDRMWLRRIADGDRLILPPRIIRAFFPPGLWPWVGELAVAGPGDASAWLERFCRREALRIAPLTRARPEPGPISAVTIETILNGGGRLFAALAALRRRGVVDSRLEGWEHLPPRVCASDLGAISVRTDRSAPSLAVVRGALSTLEARLATLRPASHARRRALRDRALLSLLVVTGARIGALSRVRVRDVEFAHGFSDGGVGAVMRLRPGKTLSEYEHRCKGIPAEVAGWLAEYLESMGTRSAQPLFPMRCDPRGPVPMSPSSLTKILTGEPPRSTRTARAPLLPRPGRPDYGYSAHTLRHLAERLAVSVGRDLIARAGDEYSALTPQAYADALLDHEMRHDHLGYKDHASVSSRELLAREAALGIWRIVRGEAPAPPSPSQARLAALRALRRTVLAGATSSLSDRSVLELLLENARINAEIDDLVAAS